MYLTIEVPILIVSGKNAKRPILNKNQREYHRAFHMELRPMTVKVFPDIIGAKPVLGFPVEYMRYNLKGCRH